MLYQSNNGETCKDQLCQHPQCWRSNVRRVREAVRRRNGIKEDRVLYKPRRLLSKKKEEPSFHDNENLSLPTLKVIDVSEDLAAPFIHNGSDNIGQVLAGKHSSPTFSTSLPSPVRMKCHTSFGTQAPHTTPVSPSIPEKKQTRWKENLGRSKEEDLKAKTISFHEIYDYEEVYQDWQETFISTAYLVWCPSKRKRQKKRSRASSAITDYKTRGFKNIIEDALPLPVEDTKKKRRKPKVPTGGQPYTPCRSPATRLDNFKSPDYLSEGDFIMTVTRENIPESLMTSKKIIQNKKKTPGKDLPHLEAQKTSSNTVLVDISSRLDSPIYKNNVEIADENIKEEDQKNHADTEELTKQDRHARSRSAEPFQKQLSDFEPRQVLPLPSVGIPWGLIPTQRRGHCRNSIPHNVDLGVIMEPVIYVPRSASTGGDKRRACSAAVLGQKSISREEQKMTQEMRSTENMEERNHLTSAYRISPRVLRAPAPTPMTPGTRDSSRRQLSDLVRSNTRRSMSKTMLVEHSGPTTQHEEGSNKMENSSGHTLAAQRSRTLDDHVILEVGETNRNTFQDIGQEFSRISADKQIKEPIDGQSRQPGRADLGATMYHVNDNESATYSARAVSPSSRTNIPPDIWAELCGEVFDDRHVISMGNLDLLRHDKIRNSLELKIYSYTESSWKRAPAKPPQSFLGQRSYFGPYKQTVLPKMPASLTVVPVSYVTRSTDRVAQPRQSHLDQPASIRMPRVPAGSPVPDNDGLIPDSKETSQTCTSSCEVSEYNDTRTEGIGTEHKCKDEEVLGEVEYLIARDVISHEEVDENFEENGEEICKEVGTKASLPEVDNSNLSESKESVEQVYTTSEQDIVVPVSGSLLLIDKKSPEASPNELENSKGNELHRSESILQEEKLVDSVTDEAATERFKDEKIEAGLELQQSIDFDEGKIQDNMSKMSNSSQTIEAELSVESLNKESSVKDLSASSQDLILTESITLQDSSEQIQPETSNQSLVSKESSDFKLEPFNVESELLQPIHIESDLFLLSGDSYLDLTCDEEGQGNLDGSNDEDGEIPTEASAMVAERSKNSIVTEKLRKDGESDLS